LALWGEALWEQKNYEAAIKAYEMAADSDSKFPWGWHKLARAHRQLGNLGQVVNVYKKTIERNPDDTFYLLWLGDAFCDNGEYERGHTNV
jgi:tetratricopeptide (TPR) repeat protein